MNELWRHDLFYPEPSRKVIGAFFTAWTGVGPDHKEKFYEKAVAKELKLAGLKFAERLPVKVNYKNESIGIYYFDFFIEDKIILELKVRNYFSSRDIKQLPGYLKAKKLKLGIIAHFTKTGVKFKRIVNLDRSDYNFRIFVKIRIS